MPTIRRRTQAFWRHTVLPLTGRSLGALSNWLGAAYGGGLELRMDLDAIQALSAEREALWARVGAAAFLTDDEKRAAVGYGAGAASAVKLFNPMQPRNPAGNGRQSGWWTSDGGGGAGGSIPNIGMLQDAGATGEPNYGINLLEDEALGGHAIEHHVGKSDNYLINRILNSRTRVPFGVLGLYRSGSFPSVEAANKLVSSTLSQNSEELRKYLARDWPYNLYPVLSIAGTFRSTTGREAYAENNKVQPSIRATHAVHVILRRHSTSPKGYYIVTAWPEYGK